MARKAMDVRLRVLKESNKSRLDSRSVRNKCFDHIPYYLSGLSRGQFFATTFLEIAVYERKLRKVLIYDTYIRTYTHTYIHTYIT